MAAPGQDLGAKDPLGIEHPGWDLCPSAPAVVEAGVGLGPDLVVEAEPGGGDGGEAFVGDPFAAGFAGAVGAVRDAGEGPADGADLGVDLLEE